MRCEEADDRYGGMTRHDHSKGKERPHLILRDQKRRRSRSRVRINTGYEVLVVEKVHEVVVIGRRKWGLAETS